MQWSAFRGTAPTFPKGVESQKEIIWGKDVQFISISNNKTVHSRFSNSDNNISSKIQSIIEYGLQCLTTTTDLQQQPMLSRQLKVSIRMHSTIGWGTVIASVLHFKRFLRAMNFGWKVSALSRLMVYEPPARPAIRFWMSSVTEFDAFHRKFCKTTNRCWWMKAIG